MATTLLDIARANGCDAVVALVDDAIRFHPEVVYGSARTIKGINYKTLVRTSNPTVAFRNFNEGSATVKGNYENRLIECFLLNPPIEVDKAVADAYEDGPMAWMAIEGSTMFEGSLATLCKQFYYGAGTALGSFGDAKGFPGLYDVVDSSMVVDATGTTATTGSSVWAVKWGVKNVQWVYGLNGQLNLSPVVEFPVTDGSGNRYTAYRQEILARPGLQCTSIFGCGRIKNLTADAGKGLTDVLMGKLLSLFPYGREPDAFFMSRRSREQLRASRTAVNPTGAPAPTPVDFEQIPIYPTDAIQNTEVIA